MTESNRLPQLPNDQDTLRVAYEEAWKEYHHTEQIIFIFSGAIAAFISGLIQVSLASQYFVFSIVTLVMAIGLGVVSILVTGRQVESRDYRIEHVIRPLERSLGIRYEDEKHHFPSLGTTLFLLSVGFTIFPLVFLFIILASKCRI